MTQWISDGDGTRIVVALVVVLVVLAGCAGDGGGADGGTGANGEAPEGVADGSGPGGGSAGAGAAGGDSGSRDAATVEGGVGSYYDDGERVVVRRSEMHLRVEEFEDAYQRAREIATYHGGYVGDREQTANGEYDEGYFTVTVPAEKFPVVRDQLADLGTVTAEHVEALDFTSTHRNLTDRLETLRADERRLERALERAGGDADEVRDQLEAVRDEIAAVEARTTRLQRRSSTSTIRVEVREPAHHRPPRHAATVRGLVDGFVDAFRAGTTVVAGVLRVLGFGLPAGVAGGIALGAVLVTVEVAWRGWRLLRERLQVYASLVSAHDSADGGDRWSAGRDRPISGPERDARRERPRFDRRSDVGDRDADRGGPER